LSLPSTIKGSLLILSAAVLMSLGGVGIKLCQLGAWQLSGLRGGIAAVTVFLLIGEARRYWSWRVVLVGAAIAGTTVCFVWGTKTTTAANTIFIQSSAPLWILLLGPVLIRESIRGRDVVSMLACAAGLALFFTHPAEPTTLSPLIVEGNWIALGAGVTFGLAIMGLRWLRGRGGEAAVVCGNALALLICLPMMFADGVDQPDRFMGGGWRDWLVLVFLGSVQIGLAYAIYSRGMRYITAMRASLIGLVEPVLNPLWVFLLFQAERPGKQALLGGALIIGATCYQVLARVQGPVDVHKTADMSD